MKTRVEAARYLVYSAACAKDNGEPYSDKAAMAKLFASETAREVTWRAVQLFGGYGYTRDYPVERMMRDAKITEIYEGTSEIQKMVIAGNLLKQFLETEMEDDTMGEILFSVVVGGCLKNEQRFCGPKDM